MIALEAAFVGVLVDRGFFFADDFSIFDVARRSGLSRSYLFGRDFGHVDPVLNFGNYLIVRFIPFNYGSIVAIDIILYILSLLAFARLATGLASKHRWLPVLLTAALGLSILTIPSIIWWSSACSNYTSIVLTLLAIDSYLRYCRQSRRRYLVLGSACFLLAMTFFESALIVAPAVVLLWLLFDFRRDLHGSIFVAARRQWRLWLGLAIPLLGEFAIRRAATGTSPATPHPTPGALVSFFRTAWLTGFGPGMIGFDAPYRLLFSNSTVTEVVAQIAVVGLAVALSVGRRGAWRAWVTFAAVYLLYLATSGYVRVSTEGNAAGLYVDHLFYGPYFYFLAVVLVLQGPRANAPTRPPGATTYRPTSQRVVMAVVCALAFAAVIVNSVTSALATAMTTGPPSSTTLYQNNASPRSSRIYFSSLAANLAQTKVRFAGATLFDSSAPIAAIGYFWYQGRTDSEIVSDVFPWLRFNTVPKDQSTLVTNGWVLDDDGGVVRTHFNVGATAALDQISASGGRLSVGRNRACVVSAKGTILLTIPFPLASAIDTQEVPILEMAYSSSRSFTANLTLKAADTVESNSPLMLDAGHHSVLADIKSPTVTGVHFHAIDIRIPANTDLCVTAAVLGAPVIPPPLQHAPGMTPWYGGPITSEAPYGTDVNGVPLGPHPG